ncbi:MAG TPA: hypothetical protein ENK75_01460 [Saprospiraceae bacterium]|nr:hypothetical protein [Saprospiraceae bacterium]
MNQNENENQNENQNVDFFARRIGMATHRVGRAYGGTERSEPMDSLTRGYEWARPHYFENNR